MCPPRREAAPSLVDYLAVEIGVGDIFGGKQRTNCRLSKPAKKDKETRRKGAANSNPSKEIKDSDSTEILKRGHLVKVEERQRRLSGGEDEKKKRKMDVGVISKSAKGVTITARPVSAHHFNLDTLQDDLVSCPAVRLKCS